MARPRSPNRDKAFQLWFESGRKRQLKSIAAELQVSEEQVRKWKNLDKWDKVTLPNSKSNVTKRNKGGQPGNQNAIGHGGTGPPGNKNAVTTGEFEALLFDSLNDDEKRLIQAVPADKQRLLLQEIQLLTVRERRMLKRIEAIKESVESLPGGDLIEGMTLVSLKYGTGNDKETDLKEYRGKLGQIQDIEEALTRVQARKQRAIESLHKFGFDDSQLQIENKKLEIVARANGMAEDEDLPDDGFLDALKAAAGEEWEADFSPDDPNALDGDIRDNENKEATSI